jgi:hypothetical protein
MRPTLEDEWAAGLLAVSGRSRDDLAFILQRGERPFGRGVREACSWLSVLTLGSRLVIVPSWIRERGSPASCRYNGIEDS